MFVRSGPRIGPALRHLAAGKDLRLIRNERNLLCNLDHRLRSYATVSHDTAKQVSMYSVFDGVEAGPPDPMFDLKKRADNDADPNKVDLGVGIYRSEQGQYHELKAVKAVCCSSVESHTSVLTGL